MTRNSTIPMIATLLCVGLALPRSAVAHVGPPFPILVDQLIPGYVVTVWADPDIGESLFYVMLEPDKSTPAGSVSEIDLWVQPVSGRLPKAIHRTTQESARRYLRFVARPELDAAEMWTVGVDIRLADGTSHSFATEVEATPPGFGSWDVLIYLFPFVLFGGLWGIAFMRRSRTTAARAAVDPEARTTEYREVTTRPRP